MATCELIDCVNWQRVSEMGFRQCAMGGYGNLWFLGMLGFFRYVGVFRHAGLFRMLGFKECLVS